MPTFSRGAIGQKLSAQWGQTVVIDNKAGAGGSIGTDAVAKAPANSYTLLMASPSHIINNSLYKNLAFDAENFSGVVLAASGPLVLVVNASSPFKTVADFIAAAKAKPDGINYASAGIGSSPHGGGTVLADGGREDDASAYKGTAPALTDLMGNRRFCGPSSGRCRRSSNTSGKAACAHWA